MPSLPPRTWARWELGYCSNVHPAPDLKAVGRLVNRELISVRKLRGLARMGTGLWLSARAVTQLQHSPAASNELRAQLQQNGLALFTLNGFPYGDFHGPRVKQGVYSPDWTQPQRLDYTLGLAHFLAQCLPDDCVEGSISTLPLGFAPNWSPEHQQTALIALCRMAEALAQLRRSSGRRIRVCLEMEPGCVLEETQQVIQLFELQLPAVAATLGVTEASLRSHLGVCFDICHQAVMFESPSESLRRLRAADIAVGKIQVSSALELLHPAAQAQLLTPYMEPRYLHQVRTLTTQGLRGTMDLDAALRPDALPRSTPWRVHFHVPIQSDTLENGALATTQWAIGEVLDFLVDHPDQRPHLEVETYTWEVLPEPLRPADSDALCHGLAAELQWLERAMTQRGLLQ